MKSNQKMYLSISRENTVVLKGIAILYVLFGHMGILEGAGSWGVHIFCFVSGYGLLCSAEKTGLDHYWKKKVRNVYFPYLFCTVIFLLVRILLIGPLGVKTIFASLLGLDFGINADQTMWYISYIFCCYFVFWLFAKLAKKTIGGAAICAGFLWISMAAAGLLGVIWHQGTVAWAYVFTFPMGILAGILRRKPIPKVTFLLLWGLLGTVALLIVIGNYAEAHGGIRLFLYSFSAFFSTLAVAYITNFTIFKNFWKCVKTIGTYSFYMYLNEGLLLELRNLYFPNENRMLTNFAVLLLSFAIAVVLFRLEGQLINSVEKWYAVRKQRSSGYGETV